MPTRREFYKAVARGLAGTAALGFGLSSTGALLAHAAETPPPFDRDGFKKLCARVLAERISVPDRWVKPSSLYSSMFMRDSFWILRAYGNRDLSNAVYQRFQVRQLPSGQVPTDLRPDGTAGYQDDDSTLLWVLLGFELARSGIPPDPAGLKAALAFLRSHVRSGSYVSAAGLHRYWLDTFLLPAEDVIQYNQGLWAVAARSLRLMGLDVSVAEIREAAGRYHPHQLSQGLPFRDVSALVGEYLSLQFLGEPLLNDEQVRQTYALLAPVSFEDQRFLGFKVCSQPSGGFLARNFFPDSPNAVPGSYHNGASWVLYDGIACVTAAWHNVAGMRAQLWTRLDSELRLNHNVNEYILTNPEIGRLGDCPPDRRGYGWSGYAAVLLDEVETAATPRAMLRDAH